MTVVKALFVPVSWSYSPADSVPPVVVVPGGRGRSRGGKRPLLDAPIKPPGVPSSPLGLHDANAQHVAKGDELGHFQSEAPPIASSSDQESSATSLSPRSPNPTTPTPARARPLAPGDRRSEGSSRGLTLPCRTREGLEQ